MQFDLIIAGGGLVGAGLAMALQQSGLRIALIDAKKQHHPDPRLFALNASSCCFLENIGLWESLSQFASPINKVHVSHQGRFGAVRLTAQEIHLPALGHVIPARYIETAFQEKLAQLSNVTVYQPATLIELHQENDVASIIIQTEEKRLTLKASIVIGADGSESTVRKELNMETEEWDYQQSAIVTKSTLRRAHNHVAYERFNREGAIAMLPLPGNQCATIWTTKADSANQLMQLSEEGFIERLQKTFGYRLGRLEKISQRYLFPLKKVCAKEGVQGSVLLVGNALHTLHPIAAQGLNLALYEISLLTESILEVLKDKNVFLSCDLEAVSHKMKKQQLISERFSHHLAQGFLSQSVLSALIWPIGAFGLDKILPLKQKLLEKMLGRTTPVPRLLLSPYSL